MPSTPSPSLSRYLSQRPVAGQALSPSAYVTAGAACVSAPDLAGLHGLLPAVRQKAGRITESDRLRLRVGLLTQFFAEGPSAEPEADREVAFVLYYFLKGYDLIPDTVPEIGLVDDALLVDAVFQRNRDALRTHWATRGRVWPENA